MTNECKHAFHYQCLKSWFENIRQNRDLTCPLCNHKITDRKPPREIRRYLEPSVRPEDFDLSEIDPDGRIHTTLKIYEGVNRPGSLFRND